MTTFRALRVAGLRSLLSFVSAAVPASAILGPNAVNPAYEIKTLALPEMYRTMGIDFLADGRMVLLTTGTMGGGEVPNVDPNSCVYLVGNHAGSGTPTASKISCNFRQPSGVNVVEGKIYVTDRDGFYSVNSLSPSDANNNRTRILAWPMAAKWHQWVFTPIFKGGKFYAPYSGSIRVGGASDVPSTSDWTGAFLSWNPDGSGLSKFAGGLRSPNGAGMNDDGDMFVMDNQGSYLPGCTFMHMKQNRFYGHKQTGNPPNWAEALAYQPPAVWIPYPSQVAGASNSQPVYVSKGPFAGQWFAGDANGPGLTRYALEKIDGDWQGTIFRFTNGTGSSGINRVAWGPDGSLYMGSMEKYGNWPGNGLMPFYKMTPKAGGLAFEMLAIHSFKDGFEIEFTKPVLATGLAPANFAVSQWHYSRDAQYGCCKDATSNRPVSAVQVSEDGKRVFLKIDGLKAMDQVVYFKLTNVKPATGTETIWDNEAWYTLNKISSATWSPTVGVARREAGTPGLAGRVTVNAPAAGRVEVGITGQGPWSMTLRAMDGSLVDQHRGDGSGKISLSREKRGQGIYLLEVRQNGASMARTLAF